VARIAKRLYGPAQLPNTTGTRYTVPAGTKTIVRHIHVSNPTAGAVDITLSIGADGAGTRVFDGFPVAADSTYDHFCYYVLEAAEVIAANASAATSLNVTINGDEIVLG